MKLVKHRNVIRLHDSKVVDGRLWLSMEYARYGNIGTYLQSDGRKSLTEDELAVVAKSMLSALKKIHKCGVMHRDVKPSNILVTGDGTVKLGDLGTACLAMSNRHSVQGTFQYLAPEIFGDQSYDSKVDLWALGMTLLELAQGFNPFQSEHFARVLYHLVDAPTAPALADPSRHSASFIDFLGHLLTLKPSDRTPAAQLLKHPFLKKAALQLPLKRRQGGLAASSQLLASGRSICSSSSSSSPSGTFSSSPSTSSSPMNSMNSMTSTSGSSSGSLGSNCSDDSEELTAITSLQISASRAAVTAAASVGKKSPLRTRPMHITSPTTSPTSPPQISQVVRA
jgi:serine/threonine protein kinase